MSGVIAAKAFSTSGVSGVAAMAAERDRVGVAGVAADDRGRMQRLDRRQRRRERFCAGNIDRAGLEQRDHALELVEIFGHQRIGRRDRGRGHADMLGREREQRVLDAVVGQDHQRTLGAQPLREDPRGRRAHLLQRVPVGDRRPRRIGARAIGEKDPVRRLPRPMLQPVADATRAGCSGVVDFTMMLPSARRSATIAGVANRFRELSPLAAARVMVSSCPGWSRDCRASCRLAARTGRLALMLSTTIVVVNNNLPLKRARR